MGFLATLRRVCVNWFWTTMFSTWLGEGYVCVSRLVADWSKVNAQKTQSIWILMDFGFFLYTCVVLHAIAIVINSFTKYKMEMLEQDHLSIQASTVQKPVRFCKNPPEITAVLPVLLQDTHYYILLTVGTGIQVSGQFNREPSKAQTQTSFVCILFYFLSNKSIPSEGADWWVSIASHDLELQNLHLPRTH